jgi:hypothetical protein
MTIGVLEFDDGDLGVALSLYKRLISSYKTNCKGFQFIKQLVRDFIGGDKLQGSRKLNQTLRHTLNAVDEFGIFPLNDLKKISIFHVLSVNRSGRLNDIQAYPMSSFFRRQSSVEVIFP